MNGIIGYNLEEEAINLFCKYESRIEGANSLISGRIDELLSQLNRLDKALSMIEKDRKKEDKKHDKVDYSQSPEAMDLFDAIRNFKFAIKTQPSEEFLAGDTLFDEACYSWNAESLDGVVSNLQNHVKLINSLMQKETIMQTENQYKAKDALQPASNSAKGQEEQIEFMIRRTGRQ